MSNKKMWIGMLAILLIVAILVIVKMDDKRQAHIGIGVIGPLTGEGATYGESMRRGFDLAFQGEQEFQLVYEDSQLLPKEGVSAIQKLISFDKVQVVLGAAASSVTLAMAPIAERNKVILFSSISTSDDLRTSGEYIFRNVPRNEIQGITAARFLYEKLGKKSVIIFKKNDEYGTNLSASFEREFRQLGGEILLDDAYQPNTRDFRSFIAKAKALKPEAVYVPGNYQEVAVLLKQAYEASFRPVFIGGDGSYSPELIKIASNAAEGSYYTLMAVSQNNYYEVFLEKFKERYGKEPDVYDAYAYEAGKMVLEAVKHGGNDATAVRDFLLSHSFEASLTGPLKFDKDGEVEREYGIVEVKGSKFVEVQ